MLARYGHIAPDTAAEMDYCDAVALSERLIELAKEELTFHAELHTELTKALMKALSGRVI